jgi:hypothetical protein
MICFVRAEVTVRVALLPDLLPLEGVRVCLWRLGRGRRQRALARPPARSSPLDGSPRDVADRLIAAPSGRAARSQPEVSRESDWVG